MEERAMDELTRFADSLGRKWNEEEPRSLFRPGHLCTTQGALSAMRDADQDPLELLRRHMQGDWGDLDTEEQQKNDFAVAHGLPILSVYTLSTGVKVKIVTEEHRNVTTFLLSSEY
jgi:hypothetical protein